MQTAISRIPLSSPIPNSAPLRRLDAGYQAPAIGQAGGAITIDRSGNPAQYQDMLDNIKSCFARGFPPLRKLKREGIRNGAMLIVGGGPSIKKEVETLRALARDPANCLLAQNDAHDWLLSQGIKPWGVVFMEVAFIPGYGKFLQNARKGINYLIASQSHPTVFDALMERGARVMVWHARQEVNDLMIERFLAEADPEGINIGGGCNGAMRSLHLGTVRGFRKFHYFGVDSSYDPETGATHTYYDMRGKDPSYAEQVIECNGRQFLTSYYLARQAQDFGELVKIYGGETDITVHGEGLIPWMAMGMGLHAAQKFHGKRA